MKQVIVIRKDLNMRKGKIAAQAAHASLIAILGEESIEGWSDQIGRKFLLVPTDPNLEEWLFTDYKKVVVSVNSEEELLSIYQSALALGIRTSLIKDLGYTEFKEPTYTAVAVGPAEDELVNSITGHLSLL